MASGFFALFDDVATLLDDVASMSKIATKKTAGILGDDLAVNAEKASGFASSREIPVLWAITKGSFINKLIIVPIAMLLSAFFPKAIIPILMIGGLYLAFEGAEKIIDFIFHKKEKVKNTDEYKDQTITKEDILKFEKVKVKNAIFVDFILSLEIVIIALSTVVGKDLITQIAVVSIISVLATIGVYGIVALIVRMDDFGYKISKWSNNIIIKNIGKFLVNALPYVIRILAVVGTIAMLLVAGGIYVHNISFIHHKVEFLPSLLAEFLVGLIVGIISFIVVNLFKKIKLSR